MPEYWKERTNPIRRFYQAPLEAVYRALTPVLVGYINTVIVSGTDLISISLPGTPTCLGCPLLDGQGADGRSGFVRGSLLL